MLQIFLYLSKQNKFHFQMDFHKFQFKRIKKKKEEMMKKTTQIENLRRVQDTNELEQINFNVNYFETKSFCF